MRAEPCPHAPAPPPTSRRAGAPEPPPRPRETGWIRAARWAWPLVFAGAAGCSLAIELDGPARQVGGGGESGVAADGEASGGAGGEGLGGFGGGGFGGGGFGGGGFGGATADLGDRLDAGASDAIGPDGGACRDEDGDRHGPGCGLGADCDDADPAVHASALERCNGADDDCDGDADEDWPTLGQLCTAGLGTCARPGTVRCGPSGAGIFCDAAVGMPVGEVCNGLDDDCDGRTDEGVDACCLPQETRACGVAVGECRPGTQTCDAEQRWGACDGVDPVDETCDGRDNDCDGATDEGVTNACGACGGVPREACNGIDDDCDGQVDEGTLNACGGCGAAPAEQCDGVDQDCDGRVDEGACHMYIFEERVLPPGVAAWTTRRNGSLGPFTTNQTVQALAASVETEEVWAITESEVWFYHLPTDAWRARLPRAQVFPGLPAGFIRSATAMPSWWIERFGGAPRREVDLNIGRTTHRFTGVLGERALTLQDTYPLEGAWLTPAAPDPDRITDIILDLRNRRGWWVGDPRTLCETGETTLGPVAVAFLDTGRLNLFDAGHCFAFLGERPAESWHPFTVSGAPAPERILGIAHFDYPSPGEDRSINVVLVR